MDISRFVEDVKLKLEVEFGKGYQIRVMKTRKNNGVVLNGVSICNNTDVVSPVIYLDYYFHKYVSGEYTVEDVVNEIKKQYEERKAFGDFSVEDFSDYEYISTRLSGKLINAEKNQDFLCDVPNRDFLDLSLVYYVEVDGFEDAKATIQVKNEHLKLWGITEEILYRDLLKNIRKSDEGEIVNMFELLCQMIGVEEKQSEDMQMYVLSNKSKVNGAVQLLNPYMLDAAARLLENDYAVLPSSVDEVILIPINNQHIHENYFLELKHMVEDVNSTVVEEEKILSNHVYRYSQETKNLMIVA